MATFAAQGTKPKMPWDVSSQTKKTPSFITGFQDRSAATINKIPASYKAGSFGIGAANASANQQRAAASANNNAGQQQVAKPLISQQNQGTQTPEITPETEETYTDGTSGIDAQGKLATAGLQAQVDAQRKAQQANAASGSTGGDWAGIEGGIQGFGGLDAEQIGYANQIIKMGLSRNLSSQDIQTALMTAMTESSLRNLGHGDNVGPDSRGLFQQRFTQGWGTEQQIMDPNYSIGKFYDTLANTARGPNIWNTAQNVQRSAFSDGSNYQKNASLASNLWNNYNQNGGISTAPVTQANGAATWINANNGKYHDYDGAFGAQCVDLYAFYTSGFAGGTPFGVGYAQELWSNHDSKAYVRVAGNQRPQMGDVAIWSNGFNGQGGHVAIVAQDNGNGSIRVLNANATSAGPNGVTVMSNLSKGSLLGYLRPRKLM